MKWYKISYSKNNSDLKNYLKDSSDLNKYREEIKNYIGSGKEEHVDDWIKNRQDEHEDFRNSIDVESSLTYLKYQKPGWLIHFTDHAKNISKNGFLFGHRQDEFLGLSYTKNESMWFNSKGRSGYNYAYSIYSPSVDLNGPNFGAEAVVFWGDGVKVYHAGDDENQIIFWGPDISPDRIFPIFNKMGEYVVYNKSGRLVKTSSLPMEIAEWVSNNYQMLK
jgi:hypothetical protein